MSYPHDSHSQRIPKFNVLKQAHFLQGVQVLLVEDEPDIAELLVFILHTVGAEVVTATNAIEALTRLETHTPHVLLCNIKLPQHNGDWLVQQIRQHEAHTGRFLPALAVTSYSREVSAPHLLLDGFQAYLDKLSDPEQLVLAVFHLARTAQASPGPMAEKTEALILPLKEGHSHEPPLQP